jgi:hypothetical protein
MGGFVPVDAQKRDKNVDFGESWACEKMVKKMRNVEMGVMGRPTMVMGGGTVKDGW